MQEHEIDKISKKLGEMLEPTERLSGVRGPRLMKKGEWTERHNSGRESVWDKANYSLDGLVLAFLIPMLVLVIIFAQRGIFPFGENSFLRTDMYHQYAPFFSEFKHKLQTGGSLLYSWDIGMGINFSALYAYYLASPMNWLILLCPKEFVIEFMTYMIVFKTGLSGLSFAWYLKKHCKSNSFGVAFFGIFYALSGYMAAYSWNIMWLDCIVLFPLIMLGLERLVHEKKGVLYCVTLGLSILSNYYISIMICIFMVIYFGCLLILEKRKHWKEYLILFGQFTVYSLLAGGMAAAVLLPEIVVLQSTASGEFSFPQSFTSYFPIFDMIARHIANVETEIGLDHWPNIYCGTAVLMLFLMYLGCRQIRVREKAVYCGLLLFFFASFSMNIPNFIWHGFHYPNSLPCRQSFIYIALMLLVCFRAYQHIKEIPWSQAGGAFLGAVAFVILAEKLVKSDQYHFIVFYVAILYLILYTGCIYLYKRTSVKRSWIAGIAMVVVCVEASINMAVTSITTTSRTNYTRNDKDIEILVDSITPSDDFFRMEKTDRKSKNDGAWEHFPSVSLFSSVANADVSQFFRYMGCESSTNAYSITGSTPLADMLFAVRYTLCEETLESPWMSEVTSSGDVFLYENKYALPLGFAVPTDFESLWQYKLNHPAEVQNNLAEVVGAEPVLVEMPGVQDNGTYRMTVEDEGEYYAFVTNKKIDDVTAEIGDNTKSFENVKRGYFLELGYCYERSEIVLSTPTSNQKMEAQIYRVNENALEQVYEVLSREGWHLTEWRDTYLAGKIQTEQERLLFTSIPYDAGWTVKVDGKEVETRKVAETFLGFLVPKGEHEITMEYEPQGLLAGIWITTGSVVILLILAVSGRMLHGNRWEQRWEQEKEERRKEKEERKRREAQLLRLRGKSERLKRMYREKQDAAGVDSAQEDKEQENKEQEETKQEEMIQEEIIQKKTEQEEVEEVE